MMIILLADIFLWYLKIMPDLAHDKITIVEFIDNIHVLVKNGVIQVR